MRAKWIVLGALSLLLEIACVLGAALTWHEILGFPVYIALVFLIAGALCMAGGIFFAWKFVDAPNAEASFAGAIEDMIQAGGSDSITVSDPFLPGDMPIEYGGTEYTGFAEVMDEQAFSDLGGAEAIMEEEAAEEPSPEQMSAEEMERLFRQATAEREAEELPEAAENIEGFQDEQGAEPEQDELTAQEALLAGMAGMEGFDISDDEVSLEDEAFGAEASTEEAMPLEEEMPAEDEQLAAEAELADGEDVLEEESAFEAETSPAEEEMPEETILAEDASAEEGISTADEEPEMDVPEMMEEEMAAEEEEPPAIEEEAAIASEDEPAEEPMADEPEEELAVESEEDAPQDEAVAETGEEPAAEAGEEAAIEEEMAAEPEDEAVAMPEEDMPADAAEEEPEPPMEPFAEAYEPESDGAVDLVLLWRQGDEDKMQPISHFPMIIGSEASQVDVAIRDASIAPLHACIVRTDGAHYVMDMGSETGTYINGYRIADQMPLLAGDILRLGDIEIGIAR